MRYIFKILLMGLDVDEISSYSMNAFSEDGQAYDTYLEWYKEVNAFEDVCDLEINTITDVINADFDEIIPTVDGIIYFLNPMNFEETEFFEMILPIINAVKRNIPTIILYYGKNGILPLSVNKLLEELWFNHFNLEGFVNLAPRNFYQVLQCLCIAMISGDTPLNIENAWMRFPIYIELANIYFKKAIKEGKSELLLYAAHTIRKASIIAEILNKEERYIISEKAAFLFAKENRYLEAAETIEAINKKKSKNYKKLHYDSLLLDGNKLFNKRKFEDGAKRYLEAAQWAAIELNDIDLTLEAFKLSVNSWISACRVEMAFKVLNNLPLKDTKILLTEIPDKIIGVADFLTKEKNLIAAKDQLYRAIIVYQKEGMFDYLDIFTSKLTSVLEKLVEQHVKEKERYSAKQYYDEIENLWESYDVKRKDLDNLLEKLIKLFLDDLDFGMATTLIDKLQSLTLKKKLTKLTSSLEDKYKESKKKELEEKIQQGLEVVKLFINEELKIISQINTPIINQATSLIDKDQVQEAANLVKSQADFLKRIGRTDVQMELLFINLNILLNGKLFVKFFDVYDELNEDSKKEYLEGEFSEVSKILKEIRKKGAFPQSEMISIFENFIAIFRDQELYENSKKLSRQFIELIKDEILNLMESDVEDKLLKTIEKLLKKASNVSESYFDKIEQEKIDFDKIYDKLVRIYIDKKDYSLAHSNNDKIRNKLLKLENNNEIQKLEEKRSAEDVEKAKKEYQELTLAQRSSIILNKAREYDQEKPKDLRTRTALKRVFFKNTIDYLESGELDKAIESYNISVDRLLQRSSYNLAGTSLALMYLIHVKLDTTEKFPSLLEQVKTKLASLEDLFINTFPITLLEYLMNLQKFADTVKYKENLQLFDHLPLFNEEITLLNDILGRESKTPQKLEDEESRRINEENLKVEMIGISEKIQKERQDIAKRKLMKDQYWRLALEDLKNEKYQVAIKEYLETIPKLLDQKFYDFAGISLIVSSFIMLKFKNIVLAKSLLEDNVKKIADLHKEFGNIPAIVLTKLVFRAIEKEYTELIRFGFEQLVEELVLFDEEIELFKSFLKKSELEGYKEILSREDIAKEKSRRIKVEQTYGNLFQQVPDVRREQEGILKKRNIMKKRYYKETLQELEKNDFSEASKLYFKLAMDISKRKDYETSSLLILISGLCSFKAEETIDQIRKYVKFYLDSLGLSKKIVKESSYYVKLIQFIMNVKLYKMIDYFNKIPQLLEVLPLLEEEKLLIENF